MYADLKLLKQLEDKVKINWILADMDEIDPDPFYDDIFTEYKERIDKEYEIEAAKPIEVEIKEHMHKPKLEIPQGHFGPIIVKNNGTEYLELEPPKE